MHLKFRILCTCQGCQLMCRVVTAWHEGFITKSNFLSSLSRPWHCARLKTYWNVFIHFIMFIKEITDWMQIFCYYDYRDCIVLEHFVGDVILELISFTWKIWNFLLDRKFIECWTSLHSTDDWEKHLGITHATSTEISQQLDIYRVDNFSTHKELFR